MKDKQQDENSGTPSPYTPYLKPCQCVVPARRGQNHSNVMDQGLRHTLSSRLNVFGSTLVPYKGLLPFDRPFQLPSYGPRLVRWVVGQVECKEVLDISLVTSMNGSYCSLCLLDKIGFPECFRGFPLFVDNPSKIQVYKFLV